MIRFLDSVDVAVHIVTAISKPSAINPQTRTRPPVDLSRSTSIYWDSQNFESKGYPGRKSATRQSCGRPFFARRFSTSSGNCHAGQLNYILVLKHYCQKYYQCYGADNATNDQNSNPFLPSHVLFHLSIPLPVNHSNEVEFLERSELTAHLPLFASYSNHRFGLMAASHNTPNAHLQCSLHRPLISRCERYNNRL